MAEFTRTKRRAYWPGTRVRIEIEQYPDGQLVIGVLNEYGVRQSQFGLHHNRDLIAALGFHTETPGVVIEELGDMNNG